MSKFFMYGSELQEIEQLMMFVPNFLPRRSGVINANLKVSHLAAKSSRHWPDGDDISTKLFTDPSNHKIL